MSFALLALLAGLLSVLAPCVLPVLPVILGGSLGAQKRHRPLVIVGSTVLFIVVFTILLKVSSLLINVPERFRTTLSALIIIGYGITLIAPHLRDRCAEKLRLSRSQELAQAANKHDGIRGDILLGAALGPIFASCSPTYALLLSLIFPQNFWDGVLYITIYAIGFGALLLLIAYGGRAMIKKLNRLADPHGRFKQTLGVILVITGVLIATGWIKIIEIKLLEYDILNTTRLEDQLIKNTKKTGTRADSGTQYLFSTNYPAPAFQGLEHWLNIGKDQSLSLAQLRGKVVLVDFRTYSCINCLRTLPYLRERNEKYSSQGLVIIGIHAPEFQFEKIAANVAQAVKKLNISYPVAQDNDLKTRRAFENQYWPAKYLIDINGNVRYTHFGEGNYEETQHAITTLLQDIPKNTASQPQEQSPSAGLPAIQLPPTPDFSKIATAETYLGLERRETVRNLGPAAYIPYDAQNPQQPLTNTRRLSGVRASSREFIALSSTGGSLFLNFSAKTANLVMGTTDDKPLDVEVYVDGKLTQTISVSTHDLYNVFAGESYGRHTLELRFKSPGILAYAFTFG